MRFLRLDRKCDARILTGERRLPVKLEMGHKRTFALQRTIVIAKKAKFFLADDTNVSALLAICRNKRLRSITKAPNSKHHHLMPKPRKFTT
jgi:hypothetical protein